MCVLPCYRTPEQRGESLLPQAPRCRIPVPSAHLETEEGNNHFSNRAFLCPYAPDWQNLEQLPTGVWGCEHTKRGCEKLLLCLMDQAANFSHPQRVLVFFLTAVRRRTLPRCSTIRSKERQPTDIPQPRLKRTNLGIVRHPEVSATTCAMRVFPRSQAQSLPPRFQRSAHKESMTILIYHNILCLSIQNFFYLVFLLKCSEPSMVRQIANTHNGRITGVLKEAIHSKGVFSPYCKRIDIFVFAKRREENSYLSA